MKFPDWLAVGTMFLFCSHRVKSTLIKDTLVKRHFSFERVAPKSPSALLGISAGTKCRFPRDIVGWLVAWGNIVVSKNYLTRQATTLVKFAQSTSDPKVLTALVEKAAELKSKADETRLRSDLSPHAPDVESSTS
jgi:hypothetical protein